MPLPEGRKPLGKEWFVENSQNFSCVKRVEVIDNDGRIYTKYDVKSVRYQLQDDGRTLKLFVEYENE